MRGARKQKEVTAKVGRGDDAPTTQSNPGRHLPDKVDQFTLSEMPPSLRNWRWSLEEIERHINDKIVQHTEKAQDQLRRAFTLFDSVNKGISKDVFRKRLQRKFGITLSTQELDTLFARYDSEGNGTLNFYEFLTGVLQKDYSRRPWYVQRNELQELRENRAGGKRVDPITQKNFVSKHNTLAHAAEPRHVEWHRTHPNRRAFDQLRTIKPRKLGRPATTGSQDSYDAPATRGAGDEPPPADGDGNEDGRESDDEDYEAEILGQRYDMTGAWCDPVPMGNDMGVRGRRVGLDQSLRPQSRRRHDAERRTRARAAGALAVGPHGARTAVAAAQFLRRPRAGNAAQTAGEATADATAAFADTLARPVKGAGRPGMSLAGGRETHASVGPVGERHWARAVDTYTTGAPRAGGGNAGAGGGGLGDSSAEALSRMQGHVHDHGAHAVPALPQSLVGARWDLDKVERKVYEKLFTHTSHAGDQFRQAFWLFGQSNKRITRAMFRQRLRERFAIVLSDEEALALFQRYSGGGNGEAIDFYTFVRGVLPPDYEGEQWSDKRAREMRADRLRRQQQGSDPNLHFVTHMPKTLDKWRWASVDKVEAKIRDKITQHTRGGSSLFRQVFELFDKVNAGISRKRFKDVMMRKFGILLSDAEIQALFSKYASADADRLNFYDFVSGVMPEDYPAHPSPYVVSASTDQAAAAATHSPTTAPDPAVPMHWHLYMTAPDIPGLSATTKPRQAAPGAASRRTKGTLQQPRSSRPQTSSSASTRRLARTVHGKATDTLPPPRPPHLRMSLSSRRFRPPTRASRTPTANQDPSPVAVALAVAPAPHPLKSRPQTKRERLAELEGTLRDSAHTTDRAMAELQSLRRKLETRRARKTQT